LKDSSTAGAELSEDEIERKVEKLLSKMTLDEKLAQMSIKIRPQNALVVFGSYHTLDSPDNKRLRIPGIKFTDGPRGVCINHSTCFPVQMARGATWDTGLEERVAAAMGYESKVQGANYSGAVCINVLRHPGWGRAQETFGEDPYHLGEMGVAMTEGLQKYVMACAKHYACNSIEESRFFVDVKVDERTLREIYLPHFKKCVDSGIASVMSAYNQVNGKLCGHNDHRLRDILKEDWGFKGFVISDAFRGVKNGVASAKAGLDLELPKRRYGRKLKKAVLSGKVPEAAIDEAVTRILRQKIRFGLLEEQPNLDRSKVACKEHTDLALEVARKSIVLLKNEKSILPLDRGKIKTIAVIGKLADKANIGDLLGSSMVKPPYVVTPLEGIRKKAGSSIEVLYDKGRSINSAKKMAGKADVVIVVAGLTHRDEGESIGMFNIGGDRMDLRLHAKDEKLIAAVAEVNGNCIAVLEGGAAITVESWKNKVAAILMVWYPGMEGGNGLAEIIFGDVNPGAKLPIVFPKSKDQLFKFDNKAKTVEYGYYHGYRLFDKEGLEPAFHFGFGLSYTEYKYGNLRLNKKEIGRSDKIEVKVDVTNTGAVPGEEIVQLYIGYNGSDVDRPVKDLKGFGKPALKPGETKTVSFEVRAEDLAYYNTQSGNWEIEAIEYVVYVGPSSRQEDLLRDTFKVR